MAIDHGCTRGVEADDIEVLGEAVLDPERLAVDQASGGNQDNRTHP
jgi:hypothetical protein